MMNKKVKKRQLHELHRSNESFKTLRTNILYSGTLQVIAIASSLRDEGKSVSAFQLANSFASIGKNTLLIDCDMRKPSLKSVLHVTRGTMGLSEALTSQKSDVIYATSYPHLSVMFSGKVPPNPSELLSTPKFEQMLQVLRKKFDIIIMDTPPIMIAADASIISRYADGTLLVVRNNYVKRSIAQRAKIMIERNGGHIIGVVLNRIKRREIEYYDQYYDLDPLDAK